MTARKWVAQVGVLFYVGSFIVGILLPPYFAFFPDYIVVPTFAFEISWIFILLLAAVLPSHEDEEWGSIWPLSGYDNAIDAIYTRGPWLTRFQELDEADREGRVSTAMTTIFGEDQA